jgi:hypothetical protein
LIAELEPKRKRRLTSVVGAFFIFLATFSIFLSLAMPGVGWVIAAFGMIMTGLSVPLLGKRSAGIVLVIGLVHLFTLGPMAGFRVQPGVGTGFGTIAVLVPFLVNLLAILLGMRRK